LRLASNISDIRAAQTLRFIVFNLELNEGLEHSYLTCRDADRFDDVCDHLVVEDNRTGEIVGTYRLQTGTTAAERLGYYSAQEFDLTPFESFRSQTVELGRACVHTRHRNLAVINLLWRGIAAYARLRDARYLIGCSSLNSQSPADGAALYLALQSRFLAPPEWQTTPLPDLACPMDVLASPAPRPPKLLSAYLSLGARICGAPAVDREFKTIDFLTLLDLQSISGLLPS
jgi:putative hemolysin